MYDETSKNNASEMMWESREEIPEDALEQASGGSGVLGARGGALNRNRIKKESSIGMRVPQSNDKI